MVPRIHVAWLIVPCLACDFLMVPVVSSFRGPPGDLKIAFAFGIVGCVLAQGNLLAAWLAWSKGPFLRRLATHWIIAAGLYLAWLIGVVIAGGNDKDNFAAMVGLVVPIVSVATQSPLWLARQLLGWRLVTNVDEENPSPDPPLSIRDLMVATFVVAVALALVPRVAAGDGKPAWPIWGAGSVVAAFISAIALLPAGALLMRTRLFTDRLLWAVLYAVGFIALEWLIVFGIWWFVPQALAPRFIYLGISSLLLAFAVTIITTAAVARDRGYRLASRREHLGLAR